MLNHLEMIRMFCAAAEAASFKEAATRLGVAPQAITRAVKELELFFGEPLFYRNTRQIRITDFGEQLASRARDAVSGVDALFAGGARPAADLSGTVRITAPTVIGRRFLLPVLSQLAHDYPQISLDLRLSDTISDVVEQQIDIGIRVGFLRDSSFIARAVTKIAFLAVGTPELIARVGKPASVQALLDLPTVALVDTSAGRRWPWYFASGQQFVPRATAFVTDDPEAELSLALSGVGFGQIADCLAMPYIREGRLVQVLKEHTPPPWDLYVYRPQRRPLPARIRVVYDRIMEAFSVPDLFMAGQG
ncbi:MAG TPA: LysR family transcriptional regulator [Methylophilaceae bacterium]|nr:LysR family transcriptional regulator [Methylophilaceae bacterium]